MLFVEKLCLPSNGGMTNSTPPRAPLTSSQLEEASRLKAIWEARKKANRAITQESAGQDMGMTQGAIWQYLNGRIPIGTDALLKFAEYLKFDPADVRPDFAQALRQTKDIGKVANLGHNTPTPAERAGALYDQIMGLPPTVRQALLARLAAGLAKGDG